MDRSYHTQDEEEAEVESDEKVRAYKYGQTLVPFGEHDAGVLKYKCPKSLQVIGFTEAKSVPRHHSMANVISFVSMPGAGTLCICVCVCARARVCVCVCVFF